jgi:hypothetical protein
MIEFVYKLRSPDHYEINDNPDVYSTKELARESGKAWLEWLGIDTLEEAFENGDLYIETLRVINESTI